LDLDLKIPSCFWGKCAVSACQDAIRSYTFFEMIGIARMWSPTRRQLIDFWEWHAKTFAYLIDMT
jgi:hypothetical protein